MSVTAFEVLLGLQHNFETVEKMNPGLMKRPIYQLARNQLDNVIKHLESEKNLHETLDVDDLDRQEIEEMKDDSFDPENIPPLEEPNGSVSSDQLINDEPELEAPHES